MKRSLILLFIFTGFILFPGQSIAIEGLSGSTWGQITLESGESLTGPSAQGYIKQGIDWFKTDGYKLNTFVSFQYRFRTDNNDYYNAFGPSVGAELKKGAFNLGIQYFWERFNELQRSDEKVQFFVNWWYGWDLLR